MEPVWLELPGGQARAASSRFPSPPAAGCVTLDSHLTSLFLDPVQPRVRAEPWGSSGKGIRRAWGLWTVLLPCVGSRWGRARLGRSVCPVFPSVRASSVTRVTGRTPGPHPPALTDVISRPPTTV